jgi:hypothetical protein
VISVGAGALLVLLLLGWGVKAMLRRPPPPVHVETPPALPPGPEEQVSRIPARGLVSAPEETGAEVAARVRGFAQAEHGVAANVVRLWLNESEPQLRK